MKRNNTLTLFWRIIIALFVAGTIILLYGRNNVILGTALIMFRWILMALGTFFLYLSVIRRTSIYIIVALTISLGGTLIEYSFNKFNEASLESGETSIDISLMTYNVFFKNVRPDSSISKIKTCNPDILVVQELTPQWETKLAKTIGRSYPYQSLLPLSGTHGIGVYSKHPIMNTQLLDDDKHPYAQAVTLMIDGKRIRLFNVHLASPAIAVEHPEDFIELFSANYEVRRKQLGKLNLMANQAKHNFDVQLLVGDLNTIVYEPIYRDLLNHWVNLHDLAGNGWGFNFPNSTKVGPVTTLDYILIKGRAKGVGTQVIEGGGSDHLAVSGKIRI